MADESPKVEKPKSPEMREVEDDVGKYKAIEVVLNMKGGKLIMATLRKDIADIVDGLPSLLKAPEVELRAAVARLGATLSMYRVLKHAPENAKMAEEALSKLLEEEKEV